MMENNQRDILARYAALKKEIKKLEDESDELKDQVKGIVVSLNSEGIVEMEGYGTFTIVPKRKYTYSQYIQSEEEKIKQLKKEEEAKGIATYVLDPYLKFNPAK